MSDRNEVLQKMSDVYGDLIEAKSYLDASRLKYKNAVSQHRNYDFEISRLINELRYDDTASEFEIIGKLSQAYRQDKEIESSIPELEKNYRDNMNKFESLIQTMNKIIEELKSFSEEE